MEKSRDEGALVPVETQGLQIQAPKEVAGGIPAVISSIKHATKKSGLIKGARTLLRVNQLAGFDCPGCAWPDPKHRAMAEFCENGAKAVADEAMKASVDADFFKQHTIEELTRWSDYELNGAGRIAEPMVLRQGASNYETIEWDEAFELIGKTLRGLDSPNEAIFYTSGRTSNEAAFMYQLMVREFGTNNMPDCSNMCHESSGVGLGESIGIGKGTVTLEDFDKADTIFILGQNPGTNHPRMLTALQGAKRNGATIVTLNPLKEAGLTSFIHPQEVTTLMGGGTKLTDLHLPVKINGDVAALQGIMKVMLERHQTEACLDTDFIESKTNGFDEFAKHIESVSWQEIEESSGLRRSDLEAAAEIAIKAERLIACWAMGLTQHKNGVANVQEVVNFLLLRGQIGRLGAGACPVRGHSNVQGDRTVGIVEKPPAHLIKGLADYFGIEVPTEHGFDTVHAIQAMLDGRGKVFIGMGGNFLSATPDTQATAEALRQCELTVHISTKLNRSHLVHGKHALILPCLGRTEIDIQNGRLQFVTVENSMGVVHASRGGNKPASAKLRSEPQIVAGMARAISPGSKIPWESLAADYDEVRDAIEACVPGFENYNDRVRNPHGFELPNGPRVGKFNTPDGRAQFKVHQIPASDLKDGELMMMTIRTHDQYNTTIYGLDDRYRGVMNGRRVVLINAKDRERLGFQAGQRVDIISSYDKVRRAPEFVLVDYEIPPGSVATYFPETNVLVPLSEFAHKSNTPASKSIRVTLAKH
jgi:molybdopterin-dependent oxidoreductase alpha subunit